MIFRNFLMLFALIAISTFNAFANASWTLIDTEDDLQFGSQPLMLYFDEVNSTMHLFCNGIDANFNGKFDEGEDEPASWYIYNMLDNGNGGSFTLVQEFERFFKFPFRPTIIASTESASGRILLPFGNTVDENWSEIEPGFISSYDLVSFDVLNENLYIGNVNGVGHAGSDHYLLARNPIAGENGIVDVYSASARRVLQTLQSGVNVMDSRSTTTSDGKLRIATISNGVFGEDKSMIHVGEVKHMQDFEKKDIEIGLQANHLVINGDRAYVTCGKSHEVYIINLITEEIENVINVGTTGDFNGPRECAVINEELIAVTTYSNDVRLIDVKNNSVLSIGGTNGKAESVTLINLPDQAPRLVVTVPLNDDYSPNNVIKAFVLEATSIRSSSYQLEASIYPNPFVDKFNFELNEELVLDNNSMFSIFDVSGKVIASGKLTSQTINVSDLNILNGQYYFMFTVGNKSGIEILNVTR